MFTLVEIKWGLSLKSQIPILEQDSSQAAKYQIDKRVWCKFEIELSWYWAESFEDFSGRNPTPMSYLSRILNIQKIDVTARFFQNWPGSNARLNTQYINPQIFK